MKRKIAIFASGNGSNFEALAEACADGRIDAEVALCVCDKPGAYVLERAARFGVPTLAFRPKDYPSKRDFERMIADRGRLINIHPALLPAFPGAHAIQDAFDYGVKVYGVTIHHVDEVLDGGRIISQASVCYEGRDIDELEAMIHKTEHRLYVDTVRKILKEKE